MKAKFVSFLIRNNWKVFILISFILIGGILLIPAGRIFPILINIISVRLSQNAHPSDSVKYQTANPYIDIPTYSFYFPLVAISDLEIENLQNENVRHSKLTPLNISPTGEQISIQIQQKESNSHPGRQVKISFLPGEQCVFGDGRACMYTFDDINDNKVILASAHSGLGGEAEVFRNLIEGTGINLGLYTTDQIKNNIRLLIGSDILINQGETILSGLVLHEIIRIPSAYIERYLALPVEQTLLLVEEITGANLGLSNEDLFILETCGWRLPDEYHYSDYPNSMQSIYLGIFRFDD